jgi:hypothetical protein
MPKFTGYGHQGIPAPDEKSGTQEKPSLSQPSGARIGRSTFGGVGDSRPHVDDNKPGATRARAGDMREGMKKR